MPIDITGNHIEITAALRDHVTKKMEKVERRFKKIVHTHVVLTVDRKHQQKAEATVNLPGIDIHALHESADMYESIDKMITKLNTQIVKYKEKLKDHFSNGIEAIDPTDEIEGETD